MDIPDAPICFLCRHPLTGEGYGRAPSLGRFVHVGCYRDDSARQRLTLPPLEDIHWHVGERVAFGADGQVYRGVIVAVAGPSVRVQVQHDKAPGVVEAGAFWPAR